MFGYACDETESLMPSPIHYSHQITKALADARHQGASWLGPDGKAQITFTYSDINKPIGILNTNGYYDDLLSWMKKAVKEGFISEANFNELIITDSCEDLIERIIIEERPADDDWTNRLGL